MKRLRFAFGFSIVVLGLAPFANAAPACSLRSKTPANARVFAKASGQSDWLEYHSLSALPDLSLDGGMSAQFLQQKKRTPSVTVIQPGENFWLYTRYCFDDQGQLATLSFELRTLLGWGLRSGGSAGAGSLSSSPAEFFDMRTGKTISRPAGVSSAPTNVRPTIYMRVSELPFAPLLFGAPENPHPTKQRAPSRRTALASR